MMISPPGSGRMWIGAHVDRVVFEPTGPYHRDLERVLTRHGIPMVKVNPRQARRFAEATGQLAKTDQLDALVLARMGALLQLESRPAPEDNLAELRELHIAREVLIKDRTVAKNRAIRLTLPLLKRQNAKHVENIKQDLVAIEAEIDSRDGEKAKASILLEGRFIFRFCLPSLPSRHRSISAVSFFARSVEKPGARWESPVFACLAEHASLSLPAFSRPLSRGAGYGDRNDQYASGTDTDIRCSAVSPYSSIFQQYCHAQYCRYRCLGGGALSWKPSRPWVSSSAPPLRCSSGRR